jgi:hypothetical protein
MAVADPASKGSVAVRIATDDRDRAKACHL